MAVLTCREAFAYHDANGSPLFVTEGETVNADDPIVQGREKFFEPFEVTHQTVTQVRFVPDVAKKARRI